MWLALADSTIADSTATWLRRTRFRQFTALLQGSKPVRILDIGGTASFWAIFSEEFSVVIVIARDHRNRLPHLIGPVAPTIGLVSPRARSEEFF
jgi:hypothetical protein